LSETRPRHRQRGRRCDVTTPQPAVIGHPDAAIGQLLRYPAAGATDLVLNPFQTEPSAWHLLWAVAAEL
jgi:hypothetical protein